MRAIRKRFSYANVMATLAVFLSLGGGAIAALRLPANAVGTRQLQRDAVTGAKVRDRSLTGADIRPNSLTGAQIKPGSLSAENLPRFGLANLLGSSGTATNSAAINLEKGTCGRYTFAAAGAEPGDAVILQGSDIQELQHAIEGGPSISNPNQLNVTVCTDSEHALSLGPGAVQLRYDTLR